MAQPIHVIVSRLFTLLALGLLGGIGASKAQTWTQSFSAEIDSLQTACWPLIFSAPEEAESRIEAVLEKLRDDAPDTVKAVTYNHLAILRSTQARLTEAREAFQKAADAFEASPRRRAIVLRNLALALKDEEKYEEALATLVVADSICSALGDDLGLTMGRCTRGNVTMYMGDYDQSTRALMKCLDGLDPNDPKQAKSRVIELQNLANVFANSGNHKYADMLYGQCADEIKSMGRTYQWLQVCNNRISSKINIG